MSGICLVIDQIIVSWVLNSFLRPLVKQLGANDLSGVAG